MHSGLQAQSWPWFIYSLSYCPAAADWLYNTACSHPWACSTRTREETLWAWLLAPSPPSVSPSPWSPLGRDDGVSSYKFTLSCTASSPDCGPHTLPNSPFQVWLGSSLLQGSSQIPQSCIWKNAGLPQLSVLCAHLHHNRSLCPRMCVSGFLPHWAMTWRERACVKCLVSLALRGCLAQSTLSGDVCWMNERSLLPHISHLYKHYGYPPSMESHLWLYLTKKRRNQILLRYSRVCISPDLKKKYTHKHK